MTKGVETRHNLKQKHMATLMEKNTGDSRQFYYSVSYFYVKGFTILKLRYHFDKVLKDKVSIFGIEKEKKCYHTISTKNSM